MPRIECCQGCFGDFGILTLEFFGNQTCELARIQVENTADQTQSENVLSLVASCATDGLYG